MTSATTIQKKAALSAQAGQGTNAPGQSEQEARLHRMIAEAAYYKAQARNFAAGGEVSDWLEAEREIRAQYGAGSFH